MHIIDKTTAEYTPAPAAARCPRPRARAARSAAKSAARRNPTAKTAAGSGRPAAAKGRTVSVQARRPPALLTACCAASPAAAAAPAVFVPPKNPPSSSPFKAPTPATAAAIGAAFLCYVTPAEHLALPNLDDVREGIIASKIAAHAADIAKHIPGAMDADNKMSEARRKLDWDKQYECCLDKERAKSIRDSRAPEDDHSDTCSMCGKFCAVRSMNKALANEMIDIL